MTEGAPAEESALHEPQQIVVQPLLELQVKALAQPLGSENAWNELGDGRVEFHGYHIRVVSSLQPSADDSESVTDARSGSAADQVCAHVILEDVIHDETPFVGENCCIVWNSIEQELSLCIMFGTELEFHAAWSALHAVQHKPYPPLERDLLEGCAATLSRSLHSEKQQGDESKSSIGQPEKGCGDGGSDAAQQLGAVAALEVSPTAELPPPSAERPPALSREYADILHTKYFPPLGTIEKHALALSLLEFNHLSNPSLFKSASCCAALLRLCHADLIENLVSPAVYKLFARGLDPSVSMPNEWTVPQRLKETLKVPPELEATIQTVLCLHHLRHEVLPVGTEEDVITVIDGVYHRLLNEAACGLLADDSMIKVAVAELDVIPTLTSTTEDKSLSRSCTPTEPSQATPVVTLEPPSPVAKELPSADAELHVTDHLKFFSSLISLSITAFSKELVAPVMGKIFAQGLLEQLSKVADRFTDPVMPSPPSRRPSPQQASLDEQGSTTTPATAQKPMPSAPAMKVRPPRMPHQPRPLGKMYSPAVEVELSRLLDATLVRLNEKQEESAINDFFRMPVLEKPERFEGLLNFLVRQLCSSPRSEGTNRASAHRGVGNNQFLLYHLLGMHDDEGSSSTERNLDAENDAKRNEFHEYIIRQFLGPALRRGSAAAAVVLDGTSNPAQKHHHNQQHPFRTLSAPLVRVLDYLLRLASFENKQQLLLRIFDSSSGVISYIEDCFSLALKDRVLVATDLLCGHVRFLRSVLQCICGPAVEPISTQRDSSPCAGLDTATCESVDMDARLPATARGVDNKVLALAARQVTLDRDIFKVVLDAYTHLGGTRKHGLLHASIRSMLMCVAVPNSSHAENLQMFLLFKYRSVLPTTFVETVEKRLLQNVVVKLDVLAIVGRSRDGKSPVLVQGVNHIDLTAASPQSPGQSPLGRYLSVDELTSPPDAKFMEDVAAFPKKLRQAIGRLSPTPRAGLLEEDSVSPVGKVSDPHLVPIPKAGSISPTLGALSVPPPVQTARGVSPSSLDLEETRESSSPPPSITGSAPSTTLKPSQPKANKGSTARSGRQLSDGKPLMRSK